MTDRRRKIEALRAKADSTTFPAEAAALRAKADELAAQEPAATGPFDDLLRQRIEEVVARRRAAAQAPKPRDAAANYQAWMAAQGAAFRQPPPQQTPPPADWIRAKVQSNVRYENVRVHGNVFEEMGGIRVTYPGFKIPTEPAGQRVQVTDVNGRTYWITVE